MINNEAIIKVMTQHRFKIAVSTYNKERRRDKEKETELRRENEKRNTCIDVRLVLRLEEKHIQLGRKATVSPVNQTRIELMDQIGSDQYSYCCNSAPVSLQHRRRDSLM